MSKIYYGRGYVYSIQYHLVWCVKYRYDILIGHVDKDVKELLNLIA
ncbi:MAG: transposase, partial [Youngiibacter sp.]|nr:transposase [Youngiibacter sp.]